MSVIRHFYTDRELRPNFSPGGRICTDIHRMITTGQNGENTTVGRYALNYTGMRIREVIL